MGALRQTGLVAGVEDPLDNRVRMGGDYKGWVRILVEGPSPIYTAAKFKLDRDHWLVRGEEVPVNVDPEAPQGFEILWEEIPPIAERAAAGDAALADPIDAYRRVLTALILAGVEGEAVAAPPQVGAGQIAREALSNVLHGQSPSVGQDPFRIKLHAHAQLVERGDMSAVKGHFEESMEKIAAGTAPAGKVRAGVLFSAHVATMKTTGGDEHGAGANSFPERHGKHDVVLSVHVPGQDPYAVHVEKFNHKKGKAGEYMAALPAVVSAADPSEVEVLWDEMLSSKEFAKEAKANAKQMVADRQAMLEAAQAGRPGPAGGTGPIEAYKGAAKTALEATAGNPASRQMVIDQYRRLGVKISDDGVVED
jgi:hypothetical protein